MSGLVNLYEVQAGDVVLLADVGSRNLIEAPVAVDGEQLAVEAFGTWITFARRSKAGGWTIPKGLRILGHQPALFDVELQP